MGLREWWKKAFGGERPVMVPYLDTQAGRIVRIPAVELRPGVVQVRIHGSDELVWVHPDQLAPGEIRHDEFPEHVRELIRAIQEAFAEQRPLSFEDWETGFRRDAHPEQEIALWLHAAEVYRHFTDAEPASERRRDVYVCVVTCLTTGPEDVWRVLRPQTLSRAESEQIVARYFRNSGGGGTPASVSMGPSG